MNCETFRRLVCICVYPPWPYAHTHTHLCKIAVMQLRAAMIHKTKYEYLNMVFMLGVLLKALWLLPLLTASCFNYAGF